MPQRLRSTALLYFPVPKVACTSIKHAILEHNDPALSARIPAPEPIRLSLWRSGRHVHDVYPSRRFRPYYPLCFAHLRWFCVVRDPLLRFLSNYSNRVLHSGDLKRTDAEAFRAEGLSAEPDLEEFTARLEDYARLNRSIAHHTRPMTAYLGYDPARYDRIFSMKELAALPAYCAEAGAMITLPHKQTGGPKIAPDMLSVAAEQKIRRYYAEDYRIWGRYTDG